MSEPLIEIRNLKKYFKTGSGLLHAVDDINLTINKGETIGIVGESGCGKSTLGRTVIGLLEPTDGKVIYDGKDMLSYKGAERKEVSRNMQLIFQDPYSCLNPRMTIESLIMEPMISYKMYKSKAEMFKRMEELMDIVGLARRFATVYPHELDGGRRQRIGIARALAANPRFIVCDEPVSALDVSIQAQILNLLMDLQDEMGLTYMFITHDMSVVKHISTRIAVMYLGQCIEYAETEELFEKQYHPYTRALLSAIPEPTLEARNKKPELIKGEIISPIDPKPGCRFAPRCPYASEKCQNSDISFKEVTPGHFVACGLNDGKGLAETE